MHKSDDKIVLNREEAELLSRGAGHLYEPAFPDEDEAGAIESTVSNLREILDKFPEPNECCRCDSC